MTNRNLADVPIIDIGALVAKSNDAQEQNAAHAIGEACRSNGFFYIANHGVSEELQKKLAHLSQIFFAQSPSEKMAIAMEKGGKAWRGFFPVGGELTSGLPDIKEGIYFGAELDTSHPMVKAGIPLHGPNLFPENPSGLKTVVLDYMAAMTSLGHTLMRGIALSLGLNAKYFDDHYTNDPLTLFRIFNYPAPSSSGSWGVGEHTDYGVLTILKQDHNGGLEVKTKHGWVAAPPVKNTFVCNIGDMLDRMTGGMYRSTPHRVKNSSGRDRLSFPFFFDPNFNAEVKPLPIVNQDAIQDDSSQRWDQANVHAFSGTYGEYLLAKVSKVFPELGGQVLNKSI